MKRNIWVLVITLVLFSFILKLGAVLCSNSNNEEGVITGPVADIKTEDVVKITLHNRLGEKPEINSRLTTMKLVINNRPDGGVDIAVDKFPGEKENVGMIIYNVSDVSKIRVTVVGVFQNKIDVSVYTMPTPGIAGIVLHNKNVTKK